MSTPSRKRGFTMIEMLVVIGIIAVLSGALLMGFSHVVKSSQRAKAQETVSNVATALAIVFQQNSGVWPKGILNASTYGSWSCTDEKVAKVFARHGLMGVNYDKESKSDGTVIYKPKGVDRLGIVDPWAQAVMKRSDSAGLGTSVPSGGTIQDHRICFAVDQDGNGVVETSEGAPADIRATAIAWSAGADGKLGTYGTRSKDAADDIYSWQRAQEKK